MLRVATRLRRALALGLIAICPVAAGSAHAAPSARAASVAPDELRAGQYAWHPEGAPADGPVSIVVSLPLQRAYVFRSGVLIGVSTVSTGKPGHETPVGTFEILQKRVDHRSNLYDDAPMPFMQRLTWDGIALHAGEIPGRPASHGCIRLPRGFAERLYRVTRLGASVVVTDEAPGTAEQALAVAA